MKSPDKKKVNDSELVLEIAFSKEDGVLFKKLKRIFTTHKLPRSAGKRT